jgi:cytochrome c-type biogenesis protein CcmH/NrfG
MSPRMTKGMLIASTLFLTVFFYFLPRTKAVNASHSRETVLAAGSVNDIEVFEKMAAKALDPAVKTRYDQFRTGRQYDSLAQFWETRRRPDLAAAYCEWLAKDAARLADLWLLAGKRYYNAVQFSADKTEIPVLYDGAIRCLTRARQLNPTNNEVKIALASSLVEGTSDPMKGISLLREVEQTDSNNLELQIAFAFFSVRSGQTDKAISRFRKALRADSSYIEGYLHLADQYEKLGDIAQCVAMLEQYAARTPDITSRSEIRKYIIELTKNKH